MGDDKLSVVEVKNEAERRDRSGGTNPVPTVESFAKRFLDDYCRAERHKPSGIAAKETILRLHVLPRWGEKRLNSITTQDVQRLKADLAGKSGKTLNNVLTVVGKMLKVAVEWDIIERVPCKIRLVKVSIPSTSFYDFQQFDRLIPEAKKEPLELLVDLLGAEAGLRCGEMRGLQWRDVDFSNRTLCVERSIWQDQVTATKGWRLRHIPLTTRLLNALSLYLRRRSPWVLCRADGRFLTKKQIQKIARRPAS